MNAKTKDFLFGFLVGVLLSIAFLFICSFFTGCCSNKLQPSEPILANTRAAAQLEITNQDLERLINSVRSRTSDVRAQSEGITDGIDRLEYLFNQYESEVNRILNEIVAIRAEVEISCQATLDSTSNTSSSSGSPSNSPDIKN